MIVYINRRLVQVTCEDLLSVDESLSVTLCFGLSVGHETAEEDVTLGSDTLSSTFSTIFDLL